MVYFRDPSETATSKLSSSWKPFYRVIKALSDVTFVIKNQLSGHTKVVNAYNLRRVTSENVWKNLTDHPSHIESKYLEKQAKQKSHIPIRVQPPRDAKLSAGPETQEHSEPLYTPVSMPLPPSRTSDDVEPPQVSEKVTNDEPIENPDDKPDDKQTDSQVDELADEPTDQMTDQPNDSIIVNPSELPDIPKGDSDFSSDEDVGTISGNAETMETTECFGLRQ